ncbi:MAG: GrpB family protein [Opitutales bacterium]
MILHAYNPRWVHEFKRLQAVYLEVGSHVISRVEHVGSTAIPGMVAKPILDIDIVIPTIEEFGAITDALEYLGYRHNGDQGIAGREVFKAIHHETPHFGDSRKWMRHHLYVCAEGSPELERHIAFRDALKNDQKLFMEYVSIKRDIELRSEGSRRIYADIKENEGVCSDFVRKVLISTSEFAKFRF